MLVICTRHRLRLYIRGMTAADVSMHQLCEAMFERMKGIANRSERERIMRAEFGIQYAVMRRAYNVGCYDRWGMMPTQVRYLIVWCN